MPVAKEYEAIQIHLNNQKRGGKKTQNEFFNIPPTLVAAAESRHFAAKKIEKNKVTEAKTTKIASKIPSGIFKGLLKTSCFLTAPLVVDNVLTPQMFRQNTLLFCFFQ